MHTVTKCNGAEASAVSGRRNRSRVVCLHDLLVRRWAARVESGTAFGGHDVPGSILLAGTQRTSQEAGEH